MPRKLPWLSEAPDAKSSKGSKTSLPATSTIPARTRDSSPEGLVDANLDPIAPDALPRRKKTPRVRSPSTSPPPAPPDVQYMREGYDEDDIYMMVEDELWSTAKLFTQHLHHAEYQRFKKLAASRGANVLDELARPVDGKTERSVGLKMKVEAEKRAKGIKAGIKTAFENDGTSSGEEDDFMKDTHLAGLMSADINPSKRLIVLSKPQSNTRAAAGLAQSPQKAQRTKDAVLDTRSIVPPFAKAETPVLDEDSSTDDDDLDKIPSMSKGQVETGPKYPTTRQRDPSGLHKTGQEFGTSAEKLTFISKRKLDTSSSISYHGQRDREEPRHSKTKNGFTNSVKALSAPKKAGEDSAKNASPNQDAKTSAAANFLAKRREDREKKEREEKRKAKSEIDIPTFAI